MLWQTVVVVEENNMPRLVGKVRWLKVLEGGPTLPMLGAKRFASASMRCMAAHIGGTDDAVAAYIKQRPRATYNNGSFEPGRIAGIIWLNGFRPGQDVLDYPEDDEFDIGIPIRDRDLRPGQRLKDLVANCFGPKFDAIWSSLRGSMTGGRPFRIDEGRYAPIGEALTDYYR